MKGVITEDGIQVGSLHFPNATGLSGEVTVAVRPEDIVLESSAGSGLHGIIKQIMVLGHYAEVSADIRNYGVIRAFMARDKVKELQQGQEISVQFLKILAYPQV
ncbi:TOBE domain protein [compost metagenome]